MRNGEKHFDQLGGAGGGGGGGGLGGRSSSTRGRLDDRLGLGIGRVEIGSREERCLAAFRVLIGKIWSDCSGLELKKILPVSEVKKGPALRAHCRDSSWKIECSRCAAIREI